MCIRDSDGPPEEIVSRVHYNGTEMLKIEDAATDMNDLEELEHNGRKYRIVEAKRSRQYGFWDSIKCVRALVVDSNSWMNAKSDGSP